MSDYYMPTVTLDGKVLDTSSRINDVTVLSGLEMTWGCSDWLSDVEPGKLTLRLLDPDGKLLPLIGAVQAQHITVKRADGDLWEGWLEDAEATLVELPQHPGTRAMRHVWEVTLIATDELGNLAADRKHGPPPSTISTAPKNQTHWGPDTMAGRRDALTARSQHPLRFTHPSGFGDEESAWSIDGKFAPLAGYEKQQNVSVLSVLHRTMRATNSLNRPYYLHSSRVIVEVMPPQLDQFTGVTVIDSGGVIDLGQYGDGQLSAVAVADGGDFSADAGVHVAADPSSRITTVERTGRREKIDKDAKGAASLTYEDQTEQLSTGAKQREVCTATFETDLSPEWWPIVAPIRAWAMPEWWADVHQKTGPGDLTYRQPVTPTANPTIRLDFLRPEPITKSIESGIPTTPGYASYTILYGFTFTRSLTNLLPNSREFAILGGILSYSAASGWSHKLTTAPAGRLAPESPPIRLGDLTSAAAIGNARSALRLVDLARITHP